ncbi:MAG: helix-turn-helix transcriptional regulator [Candidatus Hydrogenedentes bacterium]|nr:helix-turn-helix transcriptional regulator [Candidatus Hydrogenedentota bacterium]
MTEHDLSVPVLWKAPAFQCEMLRHGVVLRSAVSSDPDLSISVKNLRCINNLPLHRHEDSSQIAIVRNGRGVHVTEREAREAGPGDVFVVQGGIAHGFREVADLLVLSISFDKSFLEQGTLDLAQIPGYAALFGEAPSENGRNALVRSKKLAPDDLALAVAMADRTNLLLKERSPGYRFLARGALMDLIVLLCRAAARSAGQGRIPLPAMERVIQYIEQHIAENIRLTDLADVAEISHCALSKQFKESTGLSPIEYLIRSRIARSCELLRETQLSITEIAFQAGFNDSNYFARQFRALRGMSASEYRRKCQLERAR